MSDDIAPVTDPDVLARYNASLQPVVDPDVLARFNASNRSAAANTAMDALTQLGVGPAVGITKLGGMPGDVESALGRAVDWGGAAAGLDPKMLAIGRAQSNANALPTSQALESSLGSVVPLPQAKTPLGKYVRSVGEMAPAAAVLGPEGAGANLLKTAIPAGVGSEAAGNMVPGSWMEPYARILGAFGGQGISGLVQKGAELGANRLAASKAAGQLDVSPGAVNRVAQSYGADKLTPQSVAATRAALGPEAMMLDTGRQMGIRAESIASQPGAGMNTILNAVEGRTGPFGAGTAQRTSDTLDQVMGPSPDIVAAKKGINDAVDQVAKPLYDQVMTAHPVVNVPSTITSRPAVAQAMKDAVALAKNHGEQLEGPTETTTELQGPGFHIANDVTPQAQTSLGYWDYVKKAMDSRINGMLKTGGIQDLNSADKADLGGLMDARTSLVNHLDNVTGGAYALARKAAATKFQVNDAIDLGRSSLNTTLLPEELQDQMSGMSLPEQAGVKLGMRREVDRIMDTARNDGAAARRLLDTNQNIDKITNVFGQPAADAISNRVAAETQFQDMTNKISGNSRTGLRTQINKDTEAPSVSAPPMANIGGMALSGAKKAAEYLSGQAMGRTREGIADLVTRQGPQMNTLANILSKYNATKSANVMTPMSQQGAALAKILATQQPAQFALSNQQGQ